MIYDTGRDPPTRKPRKGKELQIRAVEDGSGYCERSKNFLMLSKNYVEVRGHRSGGKSNF